MTTSPGTRRRTDPACSALGLSDAERLPRAVAAKETAGPHPPPFNRFLSGARYKIDEALTEGVALCIARGPPHTKRGDPHGRAAGKESTQ